MMKKRKQVLINPKTGKKFIIDNSNSDNCGCTMTVKEFMFHTDMQIKMNRSGYDSLTEEEKERFKKLTERIEEEDKERDITTRITEDMKILDIIKIYQEELDEVTKDIELNFSLPDYVYNILCSPFILVTPYGEYNLDMVDYIEDQKTLDSINNCDRLNIYLLFDCSTDNDRENSIEIKKFKKTLRHILFDSIEEDQCLIMKINDEPITDINIFIEVIDRYINQFKDITSRVLENYL